MANAKLDAATAREWTGRIRGLPPQVQAAILAALSPEAPAREGVVAKWVEGSVHHDDCAKIVGKGMFTPDCDCGLDAARAALTPRHEAPASEGDA